MRTAESIAAAAFSITLLLVLDKGIWWRARLALSTEYGEVEHWTIPRVFPTQARFHAVKLLLGLCFMAFFVGTANGGVSTELGFGTCVAILLLFGIASFLESMRAFRHFAEHNLPPPERGGYIDR